MHHKEKQRTHLDRIILCWNILKQTIALPSSKKKWGEGMSTEQKLTVILWKIWALLRIQCDNTYSQNIVGIQIKKKKEYFLKSLRYFQCKYRSVLLQLAHLTILNILEKILWKIFFPRQPRINFSTVILNFFRDILLVFHTIIICHSGTRLPCNHEEWTVVFYPQTAIDMLYLALSQSWVLCPIFSVISANFHGKGWRKRPLGAVIKSNTKARYKPTSWNHEL